MHDTPSQSLFGRNFRAASSGCVRVHGIEQLAAWVLADQGWRPEHVLQMKESGERRDVTLKKPVPLYFVYITAWATEDGVVAVPPRPLPQGRHRPDGRGVRGVDSPGLIPWQLILVWLRLRREGREIIRLIEEDGWFLVATRGSHRQYITRSSRDVLQWRASLRMTSLGVRSTAS